MEGKLREISGEASERSGDILQNIFHWMRAIPYISEFTKRSLVHQHYFLLILLVGCRPYSLSAAHCYSTSYKIVKQVHMDFYSILISILRRLPGYVVIVVSIIHGICVVGGGYPPQPRILSAEEGGEPCGPYCLESVVYRAISVVVYSSYAVNSDGGGSK